MGALGIRYDIPYYQFILVMYGTFLTVPTLQAGNYAL